MTFAEPIFPVTKYNFDNNVSLEERIKKSLYGKPSNANFIPRLEEEIEGKIEVDGRIKYFKK